MRTIRTLAMAALLALSVFAVAQQPVAPGPKGGSPAFGAQNKQSAMQRLVKAQNEVLAQLNLTKDQKGQIAEIRKDTVKQLKELAAQKKRSTTPFDPEEMRTQRRAIMKDSQKKLMGVLTPDQRKQYVALWKEEAKKLRDQRGSGAGTGPSKP